MYFNIDNYIQMYDTLQRKIQTFLQKFQNIKDFFPKGPLPRYSYDSHNL
jgi:hypothetical protein